MKSVASCVFEAPHTKPTSWRYPGSPIAAAKRESSLHTTGDIRVSVLALVSSPLPRLQLLHQRLRELFECIGQDDHLHQGAKLIEKLPAARQRL